TTNVIADPGAIANKGYVLKYSLASLSIAPHSGFGGCTPSPINERPEAISMEVPISWVPCTINGDNALGVICFMIIVISEKPNALAASTYSISFMLITELRKILAKSGMVNIATATIVFNIPFPKTATMTIANRIPGNASKTSINLII